MNSKQYSNRALVIAASILGGCILMAAWMVAYGQSSNFISPFYKMSIRRQVRAQLYSALGNTPSTLSDGTPVTLDKVQLGDIKFSKDKESFSLVYTLSFKPKGELSGGEWFLKQNDGSHRAVIGSPFIKMPTIEKGVDGVPIGIH